tara:strand:+ start:1192 stop:1512 length:321 start_codon:yes stop_codon:yes gene_type:complete
MQRCNIISDRPGRWLAILLVTPLLLVGATLTLDCQPWVATGLYVFAGILCVYELFWIYVRRKFEVAYIPYGSVMSPHRCRYHVPSLLSVSMCMMEESPALAHDGQN